MTIILNPPPAESGGGASTIADGADVAQGAVADAAYSGTGNTTVIGGLKGIWSRVNAAASALGAIGDAAWTSGNGTVIGVLKAAVGGIGAVGDAAWSSGNGTLVAILKAISGSNTTIAGSVASSRMNIRLQRDVATPSAVTIANAAQDSQALDISAWIAGGFLIPSPFTGSSVTYKVSHTTSGHVELRDQFGNTVTTPVAAGIAYPIPAEAAGFNSLIIRSSAAEGGSRTINWVRKG